jgi:hypothetical protein
MFKWVCLGVAVFFLAELSWMINDLRLQARHSGEVVKEMGGTINQHLPEIVEKTRTTAETLAELSEDLRQLKELAGVAHTVRDKNLVAYATSLLDAVEASGGQIGLKKTFGGSGLKNLVPAKEWVVSARKEALVLTILVRSKTELMTRLAKNKFGSHWYIQIGDREPMTLMDWLKANHPATKELSAG